MPQLPSPDALVSSVGEHALLPLIAQRLAAVGGDSGVLLGPGDDAAVISAPDQRVVVSTDVLVADRHFRTSWSTPEQIGRRVAVANLSDINAMGARATAMVVALVLPSDTTVGFVLGLADGLALESARAGATVVGGDLSSGSELSIAATVLGDLNGRDPITRSGAQPSDVVAVCGRLGWSAAGLTILQRGFRSPRVLTDAYRHAEPDYEAGPRAAQAGATSLIDVSDGLLADLGHIAQQSGVAIDIDTNQLAVAESMRDAASALGVDPLDWVLTGGEDHSLVATFPCGVSLPEGFQAIGNVIDHGESTVTIDGAVYVNQTGLGWDHFA